jgi:hypothetical protein
MGRCVRNNGTWPPLNGTKERRIVICGSWRCKVRRSKSFCFAAEDRRKKSLGPPSQSIFLTALRRAVAAPCGSCIDRSEATTRTTIEIAAEFPNGVSDTSKRGVSENVANLGFKTKDWRGDPSAAVRSDGFDDAV